MFCASFVTNDSGPVQSSEAGLASQIDTSESSARNVFNPHSGFRAGTPRNSIEMSRKADYHTEWAMPHPANYYVTRRDEEKPGVPGSQA